MKLFDFRLVHWFWSGPCHRVPEPQIICCRWLSRPCKGWRSIMESPSDFASRVWQSLLMLRLEKLHSLSFHLWSIFVPSISVLACPCRVGSPGSWFGIPLACDCTSCRSNKTVDSWTHCCSFFLQTCWFHFLHYPLLMFEERLVMWEKFIVFYKAVVYMV